METLQDTWQWWVDNPDRFWNSLRAHLEVSGASLALAIAIALVLAVVALASGSVGAFVVIQLGNLGRVVPSLVVLALALPLVGVGFRPSLIALVLIGIPPILVNAYQGLVTVDAATLEAARGVGMGRWQILRTIRVPLAVPLAVAGTRTSAVQIVSTATLAALIGGGGLGEIVFDGIANIRNDIILAGVLPIATLALAVEGVFALIERGVTPRGLRLTS
jgi:osmoprotectant transport system permease protein